MSNTSSHPYALSWKVDAPIMVTGMALGLSQFLTKDKSLLNSERVAALDFNNVNKFDRSAVYNFSPKASKASDVFFYTSLVAPSLLMIDPKIRSDWKEIALITSETFIVGMSLTLLAKNLSSRARPFLYNPDIPIEDKLAPDGRNSFFSGHTSVTAMSSFMIAKIITDYHPNSKLKPLIWTAATAVPITTGMLRYKAGKHFFTDVLAGFTVGALTGYFVPHLHQSIRKKREAKSQFTIDHFGNKIGIKDLAVDSIDF